MKKNKNEETSMLGDDLGLCTTLYLSGASKQIDFGLARLGCSPKLILQSIAELPVVFEEI
jgi:hypothetical protein